MFVSSGSNIIGTTDTDAAVHELPCQSNGPHTRARVTAKQAVTTEIAATLDRTNISIGKAASKLQDAAHSFSQ